MIYQLAVAAVIAAVASAAMYKEDPEHQKFLWEAFKREFNREFPTMDEETHRFAVFINNLKLMDKRNKEESATGGNAVHGITKFSDMTQAEFEAHLLTSDPLLKSADSDREIMTEVPAPLDTTGSKDWTGTYTTPVKDQGYCGSCWAFSATEQIESDSMRTLKYSTALSAEQITQCDTKSQGCNGGWTERAYDYVKGAGLETDKDYPYTSYQGTTGKCSANSSKYVIGVKGYTTVKGESNMGNYVLGTGPLSVCVDATTWNSYTGGIMSSCGKRINHCVQAVGVNTASSGGYWKVRNSWGTKWGESGHIRLAYGKDTCGITNDPTWVTVFKK